MKKVFITFIILFISINAFTKNPNKEEQKILKSINWLMDTPLNKQEDKRKKLNTTVLRWAIEHKELKIQINENNASFSTLPYYLMIFIAGWSKYAILNQDYDNELQGNLAGINSVIDFYSKNREIVPEDIDIEKFIHLKNNGELISFIENNILIVD